MRSSVIALFLVFLTVSAAAYAHASLMHASPSAGSTVSVAPHEVTLTFTDTLEAAVGRSKRGRETLTNRFPEIQWVRTGSLDRGLSQSLG
jgi:methionine-rich copper-binding protein CopC